MRSDFAQARHHLEQAWVNLNGNDETSQKAREALDMLVEAVAVAEFSRTGQKAKVIDFNRSQRRRVRSTHGGGLKRES